LKVRSSRRPAAARQSARIVSTVRSTGLDLSLGTGQCARDPRAAQPGPTPKGRPGASSASCSFAGGNGETEAETPVGPDRLDRITGDRGSGTGAGVVIARIASGAVPVAINQTARATRVVVLPLQYTRLSPDACPADRYAPSLPLLPGRRNRSLAPVEEGEYPPL
jgi:hypothetical protein